MATIKKNNGVLDPQTQQTIDKLVNEIVRQLETKTTAIVYKNHLWHTDGIARVVGRMFKKEGYHCAIDFVPNGYRSIIVSKIDIPHSCGRLVILEFI